MENMIKTIKISQLFGDKDIEWNLQKTNVLVGKNGMGKSTIGVCQDSCHLFRN